MSNPVIELQKIYVNTINNYINFFRYFNFTHLHRCLLNTQNTYTTSVQNFFSKYSKLLLTDHYHPKACAIHVYIMTSAIMQRVLASNLYEQNMIICKQLLHSFSRGKKYNLLAYIFYVVSSQAATIIFNIFFYQLHRTFNMTCMKYMIISG